MLFASPIPIPWEQAPFLREQHANSKKEASGRPRGLTSFLFPPHHAKRTVNLSPEGSNCGEISVLRKVFNPGRFEIPEISTGEALGCPCSFEDLHAGWYTTPRRNAQQLKPTIPRGRTQAYSRLTCWPTHGVGGPDSVKT